jgi:hypothetical protein
LTLATITPPVAHEKRTSLSEIRVKTPLQGDIVPDVSQNKKLSREMLIKEIAITARKTRRSLPKNLTNGLRRESRRWQEVFCFKESLPYNIPVIDVYRKNVADSQLKVCDPGSHQTAPHYLESI